ncbi:hypothetical protein CMO83_04290 [Candidatus Woesearchaeota archaeon]|jgi:uncharacterized membrane protein|nr:hypothetical protein [Candidatus Woesearchaeota archaeon]|tara:strand:- start:128 stop:772 length:645 start_codon:yes stop_codon:yes gene_type:complete
MGFLTFSKILLILLLPFLLFLLVFNIVSFDNLFYEKKFAEYQVDQNVAGADSLHEKVINFIRGGNNELPDDFNEREKQHLFDVRNTIRFSTIVFFILIVIFVILLLIAVYTLKINNYITSFVGKILVFGGFLTIILAAVLFLLINSDFAATFESFHLLFFEKGTYLFDPANELIVNLYPEQIFMDLGIKISVWVVLASIIVVVLGFYLLKNKKN